MRHRPIITALVICNAVTLLVAGASVASGADAKAKPQGARGAAGAPAAGARPGARKPAGPPFLKAAATYLGLKPEALRKQLGATGTLAGLTTASGKSVEGLKSAIIADETRAAAADVTAGRVTQDQADARVARVTADIENIVSKPLPKGPGGCRPPAGGAGAPAVGGAPAAGTDTGAGYGSDTGGATTGETAGTGTYL